MTLGRESDTAATPEPQSPVDPSLREPRTGAQSESPPASPPGSRAESRAASSALTVVPAKSALFDRNVPLGLQTAASWAWRVIAIIAMAALVGWVLRYLSEVVIPLAIASLLAAMLFPVATKLVSWGLPRAAAAAISVLGGIILITGALILIGTQIARQAPELADNVVTGFYALLNWLRDGPLPIDDSYLRLDDWIARVQEFLSTSQSTVATYASDIGAGIGHFLAGLAIAIFALFYFLYDGRGIWTFLLRFFPSHTRSQVDTAARRGWQSLVAYVRATVLVALVDAVGVLIVALILGVPLAPALAALVFIGAFIPLVGAFVSGFLAVLVALVAVGWVQGLIMLAGIVAVMQLEGHILQPFLLGRAVKLHPLAVLLGIAIGVVVGGIVGALLSIPILAFSKAFIQDLRQLPHDEPVVMAEKQARVG